ncbi:FadR family transcriptional regulator, partial [Photobacterium damselae subsp. damselae]|nr:FadR family transcriptional regulator [Photobacterium damselae subsp. damselae]
WLSFDKHSEIIAEFQKVRQTLEPQAAALAAINASDDERQELHQLMLEMHALGDDFNQERWIEVDTRFHQLIYFASGNHFISPFGNLFKAVFEKYFRVVTREQILKLELHQQIVDGILEKDSDKAYQASLALVK